MRRREFIAGLVGTAAWPLAAPAQRAEMPAIGFLHSASLDTMRPENLAGFRQGLIEVGYAEGRNVAIEYRWSAGRNDVLPALADDLVRRRVTLIVTMSTTPCALAAKAATKTIPIVFLIGANPVEVGLVTSLNRPGGNITGVGTLATEVVAKRLQMLRDIVPTADPIALLVNPANVANEARELVDAARSLGVRLLVLNATHAGDIEAAFGRLIEARAGALLVTADPLFFTLRNEIIALSTRHALPTTHMDRAEVVAGGLMSYGPNILEGSRVVGGYTGRILKGEKPGDLPVQQATHMTLAINLRTAKALGLTIPETLLATADEIIQ
jgi:putative ABC transport system substrate-binding protein